MDKGQLANIIWKYCDEARASSITTTEYKDFILGFIFYKFLSDNLVKHLKSIHFDDNKIKDKLNENFVTLVDSLKDEKGYFIEYKNLFSTWVDNLDKLLFDDINIAFMSFDRNIGEEYKSVYQNIFDSLREKLPKLGQTEKERVGHIRKIIEIINEIPTDNINRSYDVLGYIYEFLLGKFNRLAEKGGEFYTPHEISLIMSDVASYHLKNKNSIKVYDPTSGSGSLLINIGQSIKKHLNNKVNIEYYAQELVESTYNLSRMNLIIKGVKPQNINVRNGDTLGQDWPFIDNAVMVDCVVANPPYSQNWKPEDHLSDPRFEDYGLPPAKKRADYAFLLHCLYHMNSDGIMQIVLPHGVLFRGGTEHEIRKNLIDKNNIETIIGLPPNIFSNTGIPTCIIILKKNRIDNTDSILFIDASKEFIKEGKINRLQGSNIKKIIDTIINRLEVPFFSKVVSKKDIIENNYNLNISKYISSDKPKASYDLYSTICGGIPNNELNYFNEFWSVFPNLKNEIFQKINNHSSKLITNDINGLIRANSEINIFKDNFLNKFEPFKFFLIDKLILNEFPNPYLLKEELTNKLFEISNQLKLIDKYDVFNCFDNNYKLILEDIENINEFGKSIIKEIVKKTDNKNSAFDGRIIPQKLIQEVLYKENLNEIDALKSEIQDIELNVQNLLEEIDNDYKNDFYDYENEKINSTNLKKTVKDIQKNDSNVDFNKGKIIEIYQLIESKKNVNKKLNNLIKTLNIESIKRIENLTNEEINMLLEAKWIQPIIKSINNLVCEMLNIFISNLNELIKKYNSPISELNNKIKNDEIELVNLLKELDTSNEFDKKAINEVIELLGNK